MQHREIIENKRGIGFFVATQAEEKILAFRREQFVQNDLPIFFRNLYLLKMDMKEVEKQYAQFVKENFN